MICFKCAKRDAEEHITLCAECWCSLYPIRGMGTIKYDDIKLDVKKTYTRRKNIKDSLQGRDRTRELVRIRDNHICQDCGKKWIEQKRRFDVHHLNGLCGKMSKKYDKVTFLENMVTLCHKCHYNRPEHRTNKKLSPFSL